MPRKPKAKPPAEQRQPSAKQRVLPPIPMEVARLIGQHLDLPSARCLARTCKSLRDAGECKVWEAVDIANPWAYLADAEIPHEDVYFELVERVDPKIAKALAGLASYPLRVQFVQRLRIEPSDGYTEENHQRARDLVKLLTLVGPRLTHLAIVPQMSDPDWSYDYRDAYGHAFFLQLLNEAKIPFPRLTHLKYACGESTLKPIDDWMLRMPNLVELEFCSAGGSFDVEPVFDAKAAPFDKLARLSFDHISTMPKEYGRDVLRELLRLAPNLESLRLRGEWDPDYRMTAQLAAAKKLRMVLVCYSGDIFMVGEKGARQGKDNYHFGGAQLPLEQLVIERVKWTEAEEPKLVTLDLPKTPNLQNLSILTSRRPPLDKYITAGIGPPNLDVQTVPSRFITALKNCPLLSSILLFYIDRAFPTIYDNAYVEPEYFVPPERWEAEGHRGMIIRQYVSTRADGKKDELWHVRVLSRGMGSGKVGEKRCWRDYTANGRGARVGRAALDKIYKASGVDSNFLEGGRGLSLGKGAAAEAAWKLVKS